MIKQAVQDESGLVKEEQPTPVQVFNEVEIMPRVELHTTESSSVGQLEDDQLSRDHLLIGTLANARLEDDLGVSALHLYHAVLGTSEFILLAFILVPPLPSFPSKAF
jgi:hypothetical protein